MDGDGSKIELGEGTLVDAIGAVTAGAYSPAALISSGMSEWEEDERDG